MILIGCDLHPSWQQVSWVDTETGETEETSRLSTGENGGSMKWSGGCASFRVYSDLDG